MSFQVATPTHDYQRKCYKLVIENGPVFGGGLTSPFEIDFKGGHAEQFTSFVTVFLQKASPFFSKALEPTLFIQRVAHSYSAEEDLSGIALKSISWIPAHVLFFPSRYEIHWVLYGVEKDMPPPPSGSEMVETEIVSSDRPDRTVKLFPASIQKRMRQKVRQARLKCALARLRVEQISEKYYAKYGNFDGFDDEDSELSSDFEFNPNEAPRKI
jgi:hypothetical protein